MESFHSRIITSATLLGFNALTNIVLALCLAHTWKHWRQVKIYIVLLLVGNAMNVAIFQGIYLGNLVSDTNDFYAQSTAACRFFMFLAELTRTLSGYAVAALGVHVLLTAITGNQGNRLRHAMVLSLMVVLSLPMPLATMSFSEVVTNDFGPGVERSFCVSNEEELAIGDLVTMFFPFGVCLLCTLAATLLFCINNNRGTVKDDQDKSDLILAYLMGAALLVFCAPVNIGALVMSFASIHSLNIYLSLHHLMTCFPLATALINIVFAYAHVYRNRRADVVPTSVASGERQRLVN